MTTFKARTLFLVFFLGAAFAIIIARLFVIQVIQGKAYAEQSKKQTQQRVFVPAKRGNILDRKGHVLATSEESRVKLSVSALTEGTDPEPAGLSEPASRRFHLRAPAGAPYPGEEDMHLSLFVALGEESRGLEPGLGEPNEIAPVIAKYYQVPAWTSGGWAGEYLGDPYYPIHRLLPSSPRIDLIDVVTLRNYLMCTAAERTAQLIAHFSQITGVGE